MSSVAARAGPANHVAMGPGHAMTGVVMVAPLAALGAVAGFSFRVMTAGVIGVNIGAGMVIMIAPFLTAAALALSARSWRCLHAAGQRRP